MRFSSSSLSEGSAFKISHLNEWFDLGHLIEADPKQEAEKRKQEKDKEKEEKRDDLKKDNAEKRQAASAVPPPQDQQQQQQGGEEPPPPKPIPMPPIEKDEPPHDLKKIQQKTDCKEKSEPKEDNVSPDKKLKTAVQARQDRRADLQDLAQGGLAQFITWRLKPRGRYSSY